MSPYFYTRRLFSRLGLAEADAGYETLRHAFEQALGPDAERYNEYHALIVRHAKEVCRLKPACRGCCLNSLCKQFVDKASPITIGD